MQSVALGLLAILRINENHISLCLVAYTAVTDVYMATAVLSVTIFKQINAAHKSLVPNLFHGGPSDAEVANGISQWIYVQHLMNGLI
jgi:hypothetical protein